MAMTRITEPAFQRAVAAFSDRALEEPVAITRQGRDHLVLVSAQEYARLKRRDRKAYDAEGLPDEWLEAARKAQMPPGLEHLDKEMD